MKLYKLIELSSFIISSISLRQDIVLFWNMHDLQVRVKLESPCTMYNILLIVDCWMTEKAKKENLHVDRFTRLVVIFVHINRHRKKEMKKREQFSL